MDAAPQPRRIGTILVEKLLITQDQLERGLREQQETGRPLGEICVARFGLDRLSLADALAEQWEEMQRLNGDEAPAEGPLGLPAEAAEAIDVARSPEDELRSLLSEAEAARAELASKTDELSRRLAALETLVVGVTDALAELRPRPRSEETPDPRATAPAEARPKRSRGAKRPATPRTA